MPHIRRSAAFSRDQTVANDPTLDVEASANRASRIQLRLGPDLVVNDRFSIGGTRTSIGVFIVGLHNFNRPEPAFDVRYDNVVFDMK